MYFDLLSLVDASVSNLKVVAIANNAITIEANVAYDFDEYIARLDTMHLNYSGIVTKENRGIVNITINK